MPSSRFFFNGVEPIVKQVSRSRADMRHVDALVCVPTLRGQKVGWGGTGYIISVDVSRVRFMPDNTWNFGHAAGVKKAMRSGLCFEPPGARIHRITQADVDYTQRMTKRSSIELLDDVDMLRPWTKKDIGQYKATLVDGNHRAAAAMALGERSIPVYVGEDSRGEVLQKDWL